MRYIGLPAICRLYQYGLACIVVALWLVNGLAAYGYSPPYSSALPHSSESLLTSVEDTEAPSILDNHPDVHVTHPEDLNEGLDAELTPPSEVFRLVQDDQPLAPPRASRRLSPSPAPESIQPLTASLISADRRARDLLGRDRQARLNAPGRRLVIGGGVSAAGTTDAGSLLERNNATRSQKRSPVINDPRVRGTGTGSLLANGSYWVPARLDLDTMLSKLDSRIIANTIVIPGPYSARYGPGTSFIDVELLGSPRYDNGTEIHGSTLMEYQTNGSQFYGRQTVLTGDFDWGLRAGYGHRGGSDYSTGNGSMIPSSYQSRDVDFAIGKDLSPDSHIEFSYLRLDQTDVEIPGAVFDLNYLITDAYEVNYVLEEQPWFDRFTAEAWYNRTSFKGDTLRGGKHKQIPELNPPEMTMNARTDVNSMSTGFQTAATWGLPDDTQFTTGVDLRHVQQSLEELTDFVADPMSMKTTLLSQSAPVPGSYSANPGLFAELLLPVNERFHLNAGGRVDWVNTDVFGDFIGNNSLGHLNDDKMLPLTRPDYLTALGINSTDREFVLWSAYATAEDHFHENWTATLGLGTSQRPPTLTELYSYGTFLSVLQQGLTAVVGQPDLRAPRIWQADLNLRADYDRLRFGVGGFGAYVQDYITYEALDFQNPSLTSALAVRYTNTRLASLLGFDAYGEFDQTPNLTAYANISYVEGRDLTRSEGGGTIGPPFSKIPGPRGAIGANDIEPLPGIPPLEARLGYRLHEQGTTPRWGADIYARIVNHQDRVASSLNEQFTPGFTTMNMQGFLRPAEQWRVVAGINNVTNAYYREHLDLRSGLGVFQPGITFYLSSELAY